MTDERIRGDMCCDEFNESALPINIHIRPYWLTTTGTAATVLTTDIYQIDITIQYARRTPHLSF
jgi:hypothetical protein